MSPASSGISRFFSGAPLDWAIWMLVGGIVAIVAGLAGLSGMAPGSWKG
jgi:hypothetical protein